uniref:RRM domain-containing protein n=1 Tax=Syphacia muris TaxID=451379 RepID=A0A0N5AV42_9BILA
MSLADKNCFASDHKSRKLMVPETYYIRLRGLPFSAREEDVRNFLNGVSSKRVTFTLTATGRASGECYVELSDNRAVKNALLLHKKEMGGRYIEVFSVPEHERLQMIRNGVLRSPDESGMERPIKYVVRLRGLPFETNKEDIREFFEGLDIEDIVIDLLAGGRPSGEAFVQFSSKDHAEKALERNKSYMGSRYVEVFRSSGDEMENSYYESYGYLASKTGPIPLREIADVVFEERREMSGHLKSFFDYDDFYEPYSRHTGCSTSFGLNGCNHGKFRSSPYEGAFYSSKRNRYLTDRYELSSYHEYEKRIDEKLFMKGLIYTFILFYCYKVFRIGMPYSVTGIDIEAFFDPLRCADIKLGYEADGRPSGDALVTFESVVECDRGLTRSGRMMGNRCGVHEA